MERLHDTSFLVDAAEGHGSCRSGQMESSFTPPTAQLKLTIWHIAVKRLFGIHLNCIVVFMRTNLRIWAVAKHTSNNISFVTHCKRDHGRHL